MTEKARIRVAREADIVDARQQGRGLAGRLGFSSCDCVLIATAISELARDIIQYAETGEIVIQAVRRGRARGIEVIASDRGPGIEDLDLAMQDGFSTGGSLGLGLPGARRLMDEFAVSSELRRGTEVSVVKWLKDAPSR